VSMPIKSSETTEQVSQPPVGVGPQFGLTLKLRKRQRLLEMRRQKGSDTSVRIARQ